MEVGDDSGKGRVGGGELEKVSKSSLRGIMKNYKKKTREKYKNI